MIMRYSLEIVLMICSVFRCTVNVRQNVTIVGVSHATPWQPESLQRIDNIKERIVIIIVIIAIFETVTATIRFKLKNYQRVASPEN